MEINKTEHKRTESQRKQESRFSGKIRKLIDYLLARMSKGEKVLWLRLCTKTLISLLLSQNFTLRREMLAHFTEKEISPRRLWFAQVHPPGDAGLPVVVTAACATCCAGQ